MPEQWEFYTQPIEYIEAVRDEYHRALSQPPVLALQDLRDQEDIRFDNGDPADLRVLFGIGSMVYLPIANLRRRVPIGISIPVRDETHLTPEDIIRGWSNMLPDLKGIIFLGGRFFSADSRYFRGRYIDPDELPAKDRGRYIKGDLSSLDLTDFQFVPSSISFSLTWGNRFNSFNCNKIDTGLLGTVEVNKILGFFESRRTVIPQTKREWEAAIREKYEQIKSNDF